MSASGRVRVIPRLDIKGPNLVKGIRLEGLRVLGKPEAFARVYYDQGADEFLFMDVVASLYERNSLLDLIRRIAGEIFVPLAVGGGLRSVDDIRAALRSGADKVTLNTAAVRRPELIREASRKFGSSTIVISIEAIKRGDGSYEAYTDNGRERTGLDVFEWAARATELGAGEIMVTSIDREGTGSGFDVDLTARLSRMLPIPVIASGGAGTLEHVSAAATAGEAQAVCLASMLHYGVVREWGLRDSFDPSVNTDHLEQRRGFGRITESSIPAVKAYLASHGVECRP